MLPMVELSNEIKPIIKGPFKQLLISEVLNSLWIEGIHSSKKIIKQIIKDNGNNHDKNKVTTNFVNAYSYIMRPNNINKKNLYTLYSLLTTALDTKKE